MRADAGIVDGSGAAAVGAGWLARQDDPGSRELLSRDAAVCPQRLPTLCPAAITRAGGIVISRRDLDPAPDIVAPAVLAG